MVNHRANGLWCCIFVGPDHARRKTQNGMTTGEHRVCARSRDGVFDYLKPHVCEKGASANVLVVGNRWARGETSAPGSAFDPFLKSSATAAHSAFSGWQRPERVGFSRV